MTISILNVANMCSHLQNASKGRLGLTSIKNTKYNLRLALALHRSGFISSVYRAGPKPPTPEQMASIPPEPMTNETVASMRLWLGLKYWEGKPVLSKLTPISRPSRLVSAQLRQLNRLAKGLPTVMRGGVHEGLNVGECMFVATDLGILEIREAVNRKMGGLLMCRCS